MEKGDKYEPSSLLDLIGLEILFNVCFYRVIVGSCKTEALLMKMKAGKFERNIGCLSQPTERSVQVRPH